MGAGGGPVGPVGPGSLGAVQELLACPNAARIYDYLLGGKDNLEVDRRVAREVARVAPFVVESVRANRAFLRRVVAFLAREGISQFLDLGTGLPSAGNVHQVAQRCRPDARVVYVDIDPVVLTHARALLVDDDRTTVVAGDVRDPDTILTDPVVRAHLDLTRPTAVLMVALLHFLDDQEDPAGVVAAFRDALAPGSFVAISQVADLPDSLVEDPGRVLATRQAAKLYQELATPRFTVRSPEQIAALFDGLVLVEPGLVPVPAWRPPRARPPRARARVLPVLGGVGHLPVSGGAR
jgi:O-methyltransferase involved in polyketide biosynthesis